MKRKLDSGKIAIDFLAFALLLNAAYVVGMQIGTRAWSPIILYWAILTVKNAIEWVGRITK